MIGVPQPWGGGECSCADVVAVPRFSWGCGMSTILSCMNCRKNLSDRDLQRKEAYAHDCCTTALYAFVGSESGDHFPAEEVGAVLRAIYALQEKLPPVKFTREPEKRKRRPAKKGTKPCKIT